MIGRWTRACGVGKALSKSRIYALSRSRFSSVAGSHDVYEKRDSTIPRPKQSDEAEKAAKLVMQGAIDEAKRLLAMDLSDGVGVQEIREPFHFLAGSSRAALGLDAQERSYAIQLLDRLRELDDPSLVQGVIPNEDSPNGGLINLMEQQLMPFRGTHQAFLVADKRFHHRGQDKEVLLESLSGATAVATAMESFHNSHLYGTMVPDTLSCSMMLNLWLKRCVYLSHFTETPTDSERAALGGADCVQDCVDAMEAYVNKMRVEAQYPNPSADTYNLLITAWVQSGLDGSLDTALELLRTAEDDTDIGLLDEVPYNAILSGMASAAQENQVWADAACDLLDRMLKVQLAPSPTVASYASVLLALANVGKVEHAQALLEQMERGAAAEQIQPNLICYNIVLHGWATSGAEDAARQAERLLHRMLELSDTGKNTLAAPDRVSYTSVIETLSNSDLKDAPERAEAILFHCKEQSSLDSSTRPDLIMYNAVLAAWARASEQQQKLPNSSGDDTSAIRAESLLRSMQQQGENDSDIQPDIVSYSCVLQAWAKCGLPKKAAAKGESLLREMRESSDSNISPGLITYNIVVGMVAREASRGSVERAEELIAEMKALGIEPDTATFNILMDALVRSGQPDAATRAEEMLLEMELEWKEGNERVKPNHFSFNIVLNGYARSHHADAPAQAERILRQMASFTKDDGDAPSLISYSTVLNAYAKSGTAESVRRAEEMLETMQDSVNAKPNTVSFNTVINALSKSRERDAPRRAEAILNRMEKEYNAGNRLLQPTAVTYGSVMNCWAKSGVGGSAAHAEAILKRMEKAFLQGNSNARPNSIAYATVINAHARSKEPGAAAEAKQILHRMEQLYEEGNYHAKPNTVCYNTTINAYAKSSMPSKAREARDLLDHMIRAYQGGNREACPNVTSFSSVINACAYTRGSPRERIEAFQLAKLTFKELLESNYGEPNTVTYINFLTACARLLPPGRSRDDMAEAIFRDCERRGLANEKMEGILRSI